MWDESQRRHHGDQGRGAVLLWGRMRLTTRRGHRQTIFGAAAAGTGAGGRAALAFAEYRRLDPVGLLATHLDALRAAGFTEAGTLWQRGGNRLLCAVRG